MSIEVMSPDAGKLSVNDPEFVPEMYEATARAAKLREVGLGSQEYQARVSLFWQAEAEGLELKQGFSGSPTAFSFDAKSGALAGSYEWKADIMVGRKKALKLKAEYFLFYVGLGDCEEGYVRLYFEKLARFTTYPYFRALFSSCAGNSGLAFPPLPSLVDRVD